MEPPRYALPEFSDRTAKRWPRYSRTCAGWICPLSIRIRSHRAPLAAAKRIPAKIVW